MTLQTPFRAAFTPKVLCVATNMTFPPQEQDTVLFEKEVTPCCRHSCKQLACVTARNLSFGMND